MVDHAAVLEDGDLEVGLLGVVEVRRAGAPLDLGGPQQRAVIAHLALEVGRVVPVDRLIQRLWGDEPPGAPLSSLQSYISRLRRVLEPDRRAGVAAQVLASEAPGYVLRLPRESIDAVRFQQLVAAGREALAAGDAAGAVRSFDEAAALWRGTALAGLGPEDEVGPIRVRLEDERAGALEDRFDAMLALGRHGEVLGDLQDAVTEHPLRERRWAQLATALYRSRRQADALRALSTARETLLEELGIDPGPELRELEVRILDQDPSLLATGVRQVVRVVPAVPDQAAEGPQVVGRREEWDRARAVLGAAVEGPAATVLIEGEPGIGKTTMLEALGAEALASGWRVALGRCAEPGLAPALWPWIEVVRSLSQGRVERDPAAAVPKALDALLSSTAQEDAAPTSAVELAEELAALLRSDAVDGPRLVVIDDLHWADQLTLDLVPLVRERIADLPVVLAAGHRPPESVAGSPFAAALGVLARLPGLTRVRLGGLDAGDVATLMALVGGVEPSPDVAAGVQRRTGGNPLFVAELARLAGSSGLSDDQVVPDAVRDVVRRRLGQLPPLTNDVLVTAAVLGQDIELRVLAEATGDTLDEVLDALDPAVVTRVLVPAEGGTYRFAHALVRDAVLADLSALRVARLHQRAADAIERVHGADADHAEPIAWHRHAALSVDDPAKVTAALTLAGDVARARSALERSEELLDMALEAARSIAPGEERVELEISALESLLSVETLRSFMGRNLDEIAARIDQVAESNQSAAMRQLATFTRWSNVNALGPRAVETFARQAAALAEQHFDSYSLVLGRYVAGTHAWLSGHTDEALRHYAVALAERDVAAAEDTPHRTPRATVPGMAAIAAQLAGDDALADEYVARHRRATSGRRDPGAVVDRAFAAGLVYALRGDAAATSEVTAFTVEASPQAWMPHFSAACRIFHTWAAVALDASQPEALEVGMEALAELDAGPTCVGVPAFRTIQAEALLLAGDERALAELRRARHDAEETGDVWWLPQTLWLLADAELRWGDAEAEPALRAMARELAERQGTRGLLRRWAAAR